MLSHLNDKSVFLASQSPRRRELLKSLNIAFQVRPATVTESYPSTIPLREVAEFLARKKAHFFTIQNNEIYITADTVVVSNQRILNKPKNETEAEQMLLSLSNQSHTVYTGVCVQSKEKIISFTEGTEVFFNPLTAKEIKHYIQQHHPFDKAGGYGIQDWIGRIGISKINGCYYNVMGLPLSRLYSFLLKL